MSEYKPTEYVVDFGDYRSNQFVRLSMALIEQNGAKLGERVVRCRDCIYYAQDPDPIDPGWPMMCERTGDDMVEPYGFCAWGERKEA